MSGLVDDNLAMMIVGEAITKKDAFDINWEDVNSLYVEFDLHFNESRDANNYFIGEYYAF